MAETVLSIRNLTKHLGKRKVLNDISLDVCSGEIFGFLGPNGSGKTTTIKVMLGLLKLETGSISICGHDIKKDFEGAMANVGGIVENPEMYKYLTGRENLCQYANMYDCVSKERINEVIDIVKLSARIDDKVSKYSLGMRQRLGIAQAILNQPKLLVLDEPTNGLDPAGMKELRELLIDLAHHHNVAVFISSHLLAELDLLCDRVGILDKGTLIDTLTLDEVRNAGNGTFDDMMIEIDPGTAVCIPSEVLEHFVLNENMLTGKAEHTVVPDLIRSLVQSGVAIYSVQAKKHSIEDVFLSLTDSGSLVGTGGSSEKEEEKTEEKTEEKIEEDPAKYLFCDDEGGKQ